MKYIAKFIAFQFAFAGLVLVLGMPSCSSGNKGGGQDAGGIYQYTGGTNGGFAGTGGVAPTGGTGGAVTGGTGGAVTGGTGGVTTGGTGGVTTGGTGGAVDAGADTGAADSAATSDCLSKLTTCDVDNQRWEGCKDYKAPDDGKIIPLGPYGARSRYNVGSGFVTALNPADTQIACDLFGATFGESATLTADLMNLRGTPAACTQSGGSWTCGGVDLTLNTIVGPACPKQGETYPVITWGNGTCAQVGGYGPLLSYVASHGYIIVAANSRYVAGGAMITALNFAEAANDMQEFTNDATANFKDNPWYKMFDMTKVGAMGHSQGGAATINAASDSRVKSVIIWNGGNSAVKPYLAVSGDNDIMGMSPSSEASACTGNPPAAWMFFHQVPVTGNFSGHLTLMLEPERVIEPAVAWWDYQLKGDTTAAQMFVGTSCGLCNRAAEFEYGACGLQ